MTSFEFEHVLRAASPALVFAAYINREHLAEQDRKVDIAERDFLELTDTDAMYKRVCRVVPRRQLPAFVRPFLSGGLEFHETVIWDKSTSKVSIEVKPSLLGGRSQISSSYQLVAGEPGTVRRLYKGEVSVEVRLLGGKIERAIIEDLKTSMPTAIETTQAWLDRGLTVSPSTSL